MNEASRLVLLYVIPLIVLWSALLIDLVRRSDISLGKKLGWALFTLISAELGAIVYIAMRPLRYPEDGLTPGSQNEVAERLLSAAGGDHPGHLEVARLQALAALS